MNWMHYLTPSPVHRKLGLVCLGTGVQQGVLPTVGPRALDHYVAVVVVKGSGWFSWAGQPPREIEAPVLLWLVPGVEHHYAPHPPDGWSEVWVDFGGPATSVYAELGFIETGDPVVPLTSADAAGQVIGKVARAVRNGGPYLEVETSAAVHELLVTLKRSRADLDARGSPVLETLARDACLPMPVSEHAKRMGMSVAELRQAVRRSSGRSPKDYLLSIRLNRAKELLATTDLPVAAIARRVGYDDPAYFTRIFTRRVGVAPSVFAEQQSRSVAPEGVAG